MKKRVKRHAVVQPLDKPYRLIPLTQGKNAIVDVEDFEWLSKWNWRASMATHSRSFYAVRSPGTIPMHREILGNQEWDHENHNTLDNRKKNLRECTHAQNCYNRRSWTATGYKGVIWEESRQKWRARIRFHGRLIHLGRFYSLKDAAAAYNQAAKDYFGEFAYLNHLSSS